MLQTLNIQANTAATLLTSCKQPRGKLTYDYMVQSGGTFGAGTLTLLISLDGGTTKNALKDASGNAYSITTPDTFTGSIPAQVNIGQEPLLYVALSGATTPNITITIVDNR